MMESVRDWNNKPGAAKIMASLELEKPAKHPLDYAELCDVLFISQVYAEEQLKANSMEAAVLKARQLIQNKK